MKTKYFVLTTAFFFLLIFTNGLAEVSHWSAVVACDDSIAVTHSSGTADGNVYAVVDNPTQLTGNDYEVYFEINHYYRNENGQWILIIPKKKGGDDLDTLTGSSIYIAAVYGPQASTLAGDFVDTKKLILMK